MRRKLLPLAIATVLACVTAATGLASGSTQVTHFSFTKPSNVCGISGTTVGHGTSVFRDTGNGTYFMSGNFVGVFTAENGRSTTLKFAGPKALRNRRFRPSRGIANPKATTGRKLQLLLRDQRSCHERNDLAGGNLIPAEHERRTDGNRERLEELLRPDEWQQYQQVENL